MGFPRQYLDTLKQLADMVNESEVDTLTDRLDDVWTHNCKVLLCGNGGSAATASHIVNDLQKCIHLETGKPIRAICLSDCTPLIMAWANDSDYANIFVPQVECWAEPGDLLICISGSGNSANVVKAAEAGNVAGTHTFGLAGYDGGKLAQVTHECIVVASQNMQQIEDMHMVILHIAFSALRERRRND